jgi:soluble lytic murein transglycosylase-like protein
MQPLLRRRFAAISGFSMTTELSWAGMLLLCTALAANAEAQSSKQAGLLAGIAVDADIRAALKSRDAEQLVRQAARLEHGEGIARSADGAISLYCLAARAGHAQAQYSLGWIYANGRGVARNDALAAAWFQRATASKDPHSARMLRRLGAQAPSAARCLLSSGSEMLAPLSTVANPSRARVAYWVHQIAPAAGIDPNLVLSIIQIESAFNARAKSPKNARGLMQLLPATARRFGTLNEWDPLDNIRGGVAYMEWLLEQFKGDVRLALAGYNAGEGAVRKYSGIPPYKETQNYVRLVMRLCNKAVRGQHRFFNPKAADAADIRQDLELLAQPKQATDVLRSCAG